jgi:hypothetical protein
MPSYAEELAAWRAQRRQAEIADRAQEIQREHAQYARERDEAITRNDLEEAAYCDNSCENLEQEYRKIVPPQRPQMPLPAQEWILQNKPFFDRHGAQANAAVQARCGSPLRRAKAVGHEAEGSKQTAGPSGQAWSRL